MGLAQKQLNFDDRDHSDNWDSDNSYSSKNGYCSDISDASASSKSRDGSDCSMRLINELPGPMGEAIAAEAAQLRKRLPK